MIDTRVCRRIPLRTIGFEPFGSWREALLTMRRLRLPMADIEQQFRRAVFNVIAHNHGDHFKNMAYLVNKQGEWRLSPAFDIVYSYNPSGAWTSRHQMNVNGKRDGFGVEDLIALAETGGIKPAKARRIIEEVDASVGKWSEFAAIAGVGDETRERIGAAHRRLREMRA